LGTLAPLWKKELARLLPELESGVGEAGEKKWQKQRLFEAVAKGLLGSGKPRLLVLDDAQWSDQETLEFVQYLMRYAAGSPLMLLATERVEELNENHPIQQLRAALLARKQLDGTELKPLNKMELGLLAREVIGTELSESNQEKLFSETEGNPFFVVETLRNSEAGGAPQSLRTVLSQRLSQLSASARELVGVASAIGREFGYSLLASSAQMDESQLVQALDELWARRILQTREDGTYSFSHGKLLEAAYEALTLPRKQMFHRRIAEALLSGMQVEDAIVARHFEMAGENQKAFEAYLRAATSARKVFANRDAISHLEKALGLFSGQNVKAASQIGEIIETLGDLYEIMSDHTHAQAAYEKAFEAANISDQIGRARLIGKRAKVFGNLKDYETSKVLFARSENELGTPPGEENIEWWQTWLKVRFDRIWMIHDSYNIAGMQEVFEVVRPVVERLGKTDMLAEYYFLLPTLYFNSNGYQADETILEYSTLALQLSLKGTDLELQSRTQFGYGFVQLLLGNIELAIKHLEEGLRLSTQIGYLDQQAYCITYLAVANRRAGNLEECRRYSEQMLEISEREGHSSFSASALANLGWLAWKQNDFLKANTFSKKAAAGWHPRYAFRWHGLWTLIDISLRSRKVDEAIEYVRQLKAPNQHVLSTELDDLMVEIIDQADKGNISKSESLLNQAVAWVKEHHYL
jgi:tetratricopeptide (TPR) repeat protein